MDVQQDRPTVTGQADKLVTVLSTALAIGGQLVGQQPAAGKNATDAGSTTLNAIDAVLEDALYKASALAECLEQLASRLG